MRKGTTRVGVADTAGCNDVERIEAGAAVHREQFERTLSELQAPGER